MRYRFPRNCRIQLGSLENVVLLTGDRKFESISLQQRVRCEPDFRLHSRQGPTCSFEFQPGGTTRSCKAESGGALAGVLDRAVDLLKGFPGVDAVVATFRPPTR
jgi:hypothetical protein